MKSLITFLSLVYGDNQAGEGRPDFPSIVYRDGLSGVLQEQGESLLLDMRRRPPVLNRD